jgi:hypothetical protein
MTTQNRLRAAVATTVTATALAFVAGIAASSPAMAENVCYAAGVTGSITGTHNVPERCVGTPLGALCTTPSTGLGTLINVSAEACVPD